MWYVVAVPDSDPAGNRYSDEQQNALVRDALTVEGIDPTDNRIVIIQTFARDDDGPRGRIVNRFRAALR